MTVFSPTLRAERGLREFATSIPGFGAKVMTFKTLIISDGCAELVFG
jgi:hypothetical protein